MNFLHKTKPYIFLLLGIIISTLIWDHIKLPYDTNNEIIGQYSINRFNPLNDVLRGVSFIVIPLTLYLFTVVNYKEINLNFIRSHNLNQNLDNKNIFYLTLLLILFCIIEFITLDYKNFVTDIDTHHEGTSLTSQLNFFKKDGYWTKTFYDYGFLGNNIGVFSNFIFDNYSIGIQRFTYKFLILVNKIFIILICSELIKSLVSDKNKEIFFLILCMCALSLASFNEHVIPFHPRIFIFLIFTYFVFKTVSSNKKYSLNHIFIGAFSLISLLFYYDIGTYVNVLIIFVLTYFFFCKAYLKIIQIIIGIFISWALFVLIISQKELAEFINQYIIIINISDYLLGIEYPKPFSEKSTRFTKALLLIILAGVFVINYIFNKRYTENNLSKFYLFYLFLSSLIFFKSGLMRSDAPHIKYTSGIYTLLIFFFILYFISKIFNEFIFSKKINFFLEKKSNLLGIAILLISYFLLNNNYKNLQNIFNSEKNFLKITKINDEAFMNKEYLNFIETLKKILKDENCIQQFTDDNAIPYFVNKPTCTKYFVNAHIIKNWTEENFIKELERSKANYIVYSSNINWFKSRNNAPNADKFIVDNYFLYKNLMPWKIYKKR